MRVSWNHGTVQPPFLLPMGNTSELCWTEMVCDPSRYTVTKDGYVVMSSEAGVLDIEPANVEKHGRLEPGRMFLVNMDEGRIIEDGEIKKKL